jgi:hypothetical protein
MRQIAKKPVLAKRALQAVFNDVEVIGRRHGRTPVVPL